MASMKGSESQATLAKRTNVKTTYTTIDAARHRHSAVDDDESEDLTEDDLSIEKSGIWSTRVENGQCMCWRSRSIAADRVDSPSLCFFFSYMRRHPCVLDRGSAFLDRHPWIYQVTVVLFTIGGVVCASFAGRALQFSSLHFTLAYLCVVIDFLLFVVAARRSPGHPPSCADEASVIQLLHGWPASSHHYGLHASEWSRSWSFCEPCRNWRPARAHHCSRCKRCVLLMDHHCVWIGQCVGANNLRYFFAYVLATFALSVYGLYISYRYATTALSIDLLLFLLLVFFTLCGAAAAGWLVARCLYMTLTNESGIEGLKKSDHARSKKADALRKAGASTNILTKDKMLKDAGNGSTSRRSGSHKKKSTSATAVEPKRSASDSMVGQVNKKTDRPQADDAHSAAENGLLSPSSVASSTPSRSASRALFFSPFQCACHAASFRVYYCQSFNYPSLQSTDTPIPPMPFYYDYSTGDYNYTLNWFLFWEDLKRMEKLHEWVQAGSKPIQVIGRHMKHPRDRQAERVIAAQAEKDAKEELKHTAMYM
jgi:hypothetical protein